MDTTTLQIPISKSLKANATAVAKDYGFSSLQEYVRLVLHQTIKGEIGVNVGPKPIVLSARNEKRYAKMEEDFKKGRNFYTAKNVDDMMKILHGNQTS